MDMNKAGGGNSKAKGSLADRAKYQFEAVSCLLLSSCDVEENADMFNRILKMKKWRTKLTATLTYLQALLAG